jgi:hypothetical protein
LFREKLVTGFHDALEIAPALPSVHRLAGRARSDTGRRQGRVFMNPPRRQLDHWMPKAYESAQNGRELVVCLIPARTDTVWWHEYAARGDVQSLRGLSTFGGCENPAPFPSAVVQPSHP